ncbi:MAG: hypothetical protein QMD50_00250 [Patescibacteria group bacterium]|nr:hypothetical protein [Patescibacteria group bacterium]
MRSYDIFFFSSFFFLIGILFASLGLKLSTLIIALIGIISFFIFGLIRKNKRFFWLAGLAVFILIGALYYTYDDLKFHKSANIEFGKKILFSGIIINNPVIKILTRNLY